jgi:DNA polymerase-3 subunit alpha
LSGAVTGVNETIALPDVNNVDKREMLNWERELIGLYISDHPLTPYQPTLVRIVTHFSGQLSDAQHEEKIRVAGLVTTVRPYMTKTNKPMGFVTIEDIQGNIELVLFPRTWDKYHDQLSVGQIIIVEGKADTGSTPPKVLVDSIRTEIKVTEPLNNDLPASAAPVSKAMPRTAPKPPQPVKRMPVPQAAEKPAVYAVKPLEKVGSTQGEPPAPDNFPDDWDQQWQPSFENAEMAAREEPVSRVENPIHEGSTGSKAGEAGPVEFLEDMPDVANPTYEAPSVQPVEPLKVEPKLPPSLYVPLAQEEDQTHPPKQITLTLRSTGDRERDKRRIKTLYGTLISFHGHDRFSFHVFESGKGHLIDFPSDTTRIDAELLSRLKKLTGEENWRIEEIKFQ